MKKLIILCIAILSIAPQINAQKKKLTVIPANAQISIDGNYVADGTAILNFNNKNENYAIKLECEGYITREFRLLRSDPRKSFSYKLNVDESIEASTETALANKYFTVTVRPEINVDQAWKLLTQVMLNYFDEMKTSDKSSGFMNTTWVFDKFPQVHIRTMVQIKEVTNDENLAYQIRISSERAETDSAGERVNENRYKPWNRVLKKYEPLINEMQMRLK